MISKHVGHDEEEEIALHLAEAGEIVPQLQDALQRLQDEHGVEHHSLSGVVSQIFNCLGTIPPDASQFHALHQSCRQLREELKLTQSEAFTLVLYNMASLMRIMRDADTTQSRKCNSTLGQPQDICEYIGRQERDTAPCFSSPQHLPANSNLIHNLSNSFVSMLSLDGSPEQIRSDKMLQSVDVSPLNSTMDVKRGRWELSPDHSVIIQDLPCTTQGVDVALDDSIIMQRPQGIMVTVDVETSPLLRNPRRAYRGMLADAMLNTPARHSLWYVNRKMMCCFRAFLFVRLVLFFFLSVLFVLIFCFFFLMRELLVCSFPASTMKMWLQSRSSRA